jgi:hypothetical protein
VAGYVGDVVLNSFGGSMAVLAGDMSPPSSYTATTAFGSTPRGSSSSCCAIQVTSIMCSFSNHLI